MTIASLGGRGGKHGDGFVVVELAISPSSKLGDQLWRGWYCLTWESGQASLGRIVTFGETLQPSC